jgi:putative endonuclease
VTTSNSKSSSEDPSTVSARFQLGRKGELLAAAYLQQAGYRLVASNFIVPVGRNSVGAIVKVEIDLVAYDGPTLCFVEVKTRASDWFATPAANVDARKQRQITRAARAYRRLFGLAGEPYRYDVVSIVLHSAEKDSNNFRIELLRNFWSEEKFRKRRWSERHWD